MSRTDDRSLIDAKQAKDADMHARAQTLLRKKTLTKAEHAEARDLFEQFVTWLGRDIADLGVARAGASSIHEWLGGTYKGDNDRVARQCLRRIDREFRGVELDVPFDFVRTRISESIISVIRDAAANQDAATIFGPAGIGKTLSCRVAAETVIPGAIHIECTQGARSPGAFARMLARRLGARKKRGTTGDVEDSIIDRLKESPTFLIIDEAHYLIAESLNILRDVVKQAGVGVALVGTIDLDRAVDDGQEFYGQWSRLVVFRYDITDETHLRRGAFFSVEEINKFAVACGIKATGKGVERIAEFANIPGWGGLGQAANVLRKAELVAAGSNINAGHIDAAVEQTMGRHYATRAEAQIRGMAEQAAARKPKPKRSAA